MKIINGTTNVQQVTVGAFPCDVPPGVCWDVGTLSVSGEVDTLSTGEGVVLITPTGQMLLRQTPMKEWYLNGLGWGTPLAVVLLFIVVIKKGLQGKFD